MKMKDASGDAILLDVESGDIFLEVEDSVATIASKTRVAALTPKKARKLANALLRAAEKAEAGR